MRSIAVVFSVVILFAAPAAGKAEPEPRPVETIEEADLVIHRFETACNSYFLTCRATGEFVVIDPVPKILGAIAAWEAKKHRLRAVWITHEHGDHLGGLAEVVWNRKVPSITCEAGRKEIASTRANWHWWGMEGTDAPPPPDTVVEDGGEVTVGKLTLEVLHLPGHSPGSLGYLLPNRHLFVGDVLFQGSVGRTDLPTSDHTLFTKTLSKKLWDLPEKVAAYPGHGPKTTIGAEKKSNWLFQDYVRAARGEPPIERPWLGVGIDREWKKEGVRLTEIVADSPAKKAGLRPGDVVVAIGKKETKDLGAFIGVLRAMKVGEKADFRVVRGEKTIAVAVEIGARPGRK